MNYVRITLYSGIVLLIAGGLVTAALAIWWSLTSHWVALSLIDSVGFLSPKNAAAASVFLSESDVLYFIFAEMPLYGLMFALGGLVILPGLLWGDSKARLARGTVNSNEHSEDS